IEWKRVHYIPDYAHFNHSRHIRAQIDCQSCHGKIEEQGVVAQNKPLAMGWCLDCHRNPEKNVVPARPISGIFTGQMHDTSPMMTNGKVDSNKVRGMLFASWNPDLVKGVDARVTPITSPQYGQFETKELPKPDPSLKSVPHPKLPGYGPENCSACHH
ncbi:MAG: cytochrome c3 family protein, partial [Candidatus Kapabacteria bacterium]|nr:cytochrome c3 family protein [Candidatus Kapabacteria bacterium]